MDNIQELKLPISYITREEYVSLSDKNEATFYVLKNALIGEVTIYLGEIPLANQQIINKMISTIEFDEDNLEFTIHYNDSTFNIISLSESIIKYDPDTNILTFNNITKINLSTINPKIAYMYMDRGTDSNLVPTLEAILSYLKLLELEDVGPACSSIANALREKNYYVENDTLEAILECIMNILISTLIELELFDEINSLTGELLVNIVTDLEFESILSSLGKIVDLISIHKNVRIQQNNQLLSFDPEIQTIAIFDNLRYEETTFLFEPIIKSNIEFTSNIKMLIVEKILPLTIKLIRGMTFTNYKEELLKRLPKIDDISYIHSNIKLLIEEMTILDKNIYTRVILDNLYEQLLDFASAAFETKIVVHSELHVMTDIRLLIETLIDMDDKLLTEIAHDEIKFKQILYKLPELQDDTYLSNNIKLLIETLAVMDKKLLAEIIHDDTKLYDFLEILPELQSIMYFANNVRILMESLVILDKKLIQEMIGDNAILYAQLEQLKYRLDYFFLPASNINMLFEYLLNILSQQLSQEVIHDKIANYDFINKQMSAIEDIYTINSDIKTLFNSMIGNLRNYMKDEWQQENNNLYNFLKSIDTDVFDSFAISENLRIILENLISVLNIELDSIVETDEAQLEELLDKLIELSTAIDLHTDTN